MNVRFEPVNKYEGFDESAAPNWQMIPKNETRQVKVFNAAGLTLAFTSPGIADFTETADPADKTVRILTIKGKMKGRTFIEVRSGRVAVKRLEVAVKNLKEVKIAFNFIEDNAGHKTKRTSGEVAAYVTEINDIYQPQTNIKFTNYASHNIKIAKDLGKVVRFSTHLKGVPKKEHEWDLIIAKRDSKANFNIFFVWEYEQDNTPGTDDADAGTIGGNCIFEDDAGSEIGETIAHEIGHYLKRGDTYKSKNSDMLMYGYTDVRGKKITKADANAMNP